MTFAPLIPTGGYVGYKLLERTFERQFDLFSRSPEIERDVAQFLRAAPEIDTLDKLMEDRASLRVVLGAFGLEQDLDKRAFIRKVIEEGTIDDEAFANRLADPAYRQLSSELGFGDLGRLLQSPALQESLATRYRVRQFEVAVGNQNVDLRLALNFRRAIVDIADGDGSERSGWLKIMGSRPLRSVVEAAFGLPQQFGLIDIDQQADELASVAADRFGARDVSVFRDPANVEDAIRRFLIISEAQRGFTPAGGTGSPSSSAALQILQSGGIGAGASAGLFASNFT